MSKHRELTDEKFLYESVGWSNAGSIHLQNFAVDNSMMSIAVVLVDGRRVELELAKVQRAGKLRGTRRVFADEYAYDYRLRAVLPARVDAIGIDEIAGVGICESPLRVMLLDQSGHRVSGTKKYYDLASVSILKNACVHVAA